MIAAVCVVAGSLAVYGAVFGFGRRLTALRERRRAGHVNWLPFTPPVPPPRLRTVSDADWLADQPTEVLAGVELDRRFYGVVRGGWAA